MTTQEHRIGNSVVIESLLLLSSFDYGSWHIQMKSVLVHSDLWGIVCGKGKGTLNKKDKKALASIMLCIKPTQVNLTKACKTSIEA